MESFGKRKNNLNKPRVRTTIQYGGTQVSFGPKEVDRKVRRREESAPIASSPEKPEPVAEDQGALAKEYLKLYGKLKKITEQRLEIMRKVDHAREDSVLFKDDTGLKEVEKWKAAYKRSGEIESEMEKIIQPRMDELFSKMTPETVDKYLRIRIDSNGNRENQEHIDVNQDDLAREYLALNKKIQTALSEALNHVRNLDSAMKDKLIYQGEEGKLKFEKVQTAFNESFNELKRLRGEILPKMDDLFSKMTEVTRDRYRIEKVS